MTGVERRAPGCVARRGRTAGDLCGAPAVKTIAGIDVCADHAERLSRWKRLDEPVERVRARTRRLREADQEYEAAVRESQAHRERVNSSVSLIYYVRRTSDGAVKIGTTGSFPQRMTALRGGFGELQVLLTHSGGRPAEQQQHRRFAAYRIGQSEWFVPSRVLLEWISGRRDKYEVNAAQRRGVMPKGELRRLVVAALRDEDLEWRRGRVVWAPLAA